jgi:hypothetical protein
LFRNASVSNVKLKRFSSACVFENNWRMINYTVYY